MIWQIIFIENMFKDIDDVEKLDTSDISVDSDDDDGVQDATLKGEDKEEELNGKKENDFQNPFKESLKKESE